MRLSRKFVFALQGRLWQYEIFTTICLKEDKGQIASPHGPTVVLKKSSAGRRGPGSCSTNLVCITTPPGAIHIAGPWTPCWEPLPTLPLPPPPLPRPNHSYTTPIPSAILSRLCAWSEFTMDRGSSMWIQLRSTWVTALYWSLLLVCNSHHSMCTTGMWMPHPLLKGDIKHWLGLYQNW